MMINSIMMLVHWTQKAWAVEHNRISHKMKTSHKHHAATHTHIKEPLRVILDSLKVCLNLVAEPADVWETTKMRKISQTIAGCEGCEGRRVVVVFFLMYKTFGASC